MVWVKRIVRALIVAALLIAVVVPAITYIVFSTPWAQDKIKDIACRELTELMGSKVEIGKVDYRPFNTLAVTGISLLDANGARAFGIGRVSARFELWHFLRTRRLVFDYAVIDAPEANIYRATPDSPLNIQPIIDRLSKKDETKPPTSFDLKIGTVIIRGGRLCYNIESEPFTPGKFNVSHLNVTDIGLHAYLRHASPEHVDLKLEALSLKERLSGFELTDMVADVAAGNEGVAVKEFEVELPASRLSLLPFEIDAAGFKDIPAAVKRNGLSVATDDAAVLTLSDIAAFVPALKGSDIVVRAEIEAMVADNLLAISRFNAATNNGIEANLSAEAAGIGGEGEKALTVDIEHLAASGTAINALVKTFTGKPAPILDKLGMVSAAGNLSAGEKTANADLALNVAGGTVAVGARAESADKFKSLTFDAEVKTDGVMPGPLLAISDLGRVTASIEASGSFNRSFDVEASARIESVAWKRYEYSDIKIDGAYSPAMSRVSVASADPAAKLGVEGELASESSRKDITLAAQIENLDFEKLNLIKDGKVSRLSGNAEIKISGTNVDDAEGSAKFADFKLFSGVGNSLEINRVFLDVTRGEHSDMVSVVSDFVNGRIEGEINPSGLPTVFREMASRIVPALLPSDDKFAEHLANKDLHNIFTADFTIDKVEGLCDFLGLPVAPIYPVDIMANVNSTAGSAGISIDAPYLRQGDKIIDATVLGAYADISESRATLYASTHLTTKKGPMALVLGINGMNNRFDTRIDWEIERAIPLNGVIDFSTLIGKSADGAICVDTHFNPGQINFGDDVWNISPSEIDWCDNHLRINDFKLTAGVQEISIDGIGSASTDDIVNVNLKDIRLLSIFETLEIDNAMIGGTANGSFKASQLLSKLPVITTDDLHVDDISYNRCVIGTCDATAMWDNEKQSVYLSADIVNPEGQHSYISGDIYPMGERLDLTFDATHVKVGFMQPFMAAFASDVSGDGSGRAHLFGTFKNIDMEGDIFAEDLRLKIDFTNTVYSATDSVHIEPGIIKLDNIRISDTNGHTALLNGVLTHEYFHFPRFDFRVTEAHDFLCYNITEAMNPDWYGTIYGNGSAWVKGEPGVIDIGARMSTAPGSVFTFVLSDRLEAEQYSFITFRDATVLTAEEQLKEDEIPQSVKDFRQRMMAQNNDRPSDYNLDFRVDITPDAQIILVMDPVGGDRIRAFGNGDMRLTYNSAENDIRMYGTYTLDRGNYNFTLQDIIIKDFTIDAGSSITFRGDPYSAQLDIEAVYQLNANLSDLDESFTLDKDLNRTNVPVQALLKVSGDMRQPDIAFDLRFPTLTSDTYRKVKSIISTDDMMNRQIIYLLALNRFYTPDYMESTTKGNELFSVASSTIASQLSNILGKLSDKWSIAPNLRSDRGDFSDVEVDVALSSRLLNNRLLLNGNLGYRDKSLNTNQFVGDFDVEYLLTPKGNWRLKGYSRYNDQNYYVRTAPTTQGVGIMFRRDFDSLFKTGRKPKTTPVTETQTFNEMPPLGETDSVLTDSVQPTLDKQRPVKPDTTTVK